VATVLDHVAEALGRAANRANLHWRQSDLTNDGPQHVDHASWPAIHAASATEPVVVQSYSGPAQKRGYFVQRQNDLSGVGGRP
jgi:hypothetical protein